jgi:hypothetical protein
MTPYQAFLEALALSRAIERTQREAYLEPAAEREERIRARRSGKGLAVVARVERARAEAS